MRKVILSEAKDYHKLVSFFIENDLEHSENEPMPTDLIQSWQITDDQRLVAALVLAKREGQLIIDGIAVDSNYRHKKLGKALLDKAVQKAVSMGQNQIFLVARAPQFFKKYGFITIPREEAPTFFECFTCPQYGNGCLPEVMRLDLQ